MRTVTGKIGVYISPYMHVGPQELETMEVAELITRLSFMSCQVKGYSLVGEATVTFEIPDTDTLITNKVDALKEELQQTQAAAEVACNKIREQIQQLLAISYKPEKS